ncbi:pinensin family lanthipeptide [Roseivirga sp. BDSF3-8]|uniref:pinensin family lanthipeptide n=1 Tax=Roseivirga sp. BDSF3-8 TaxID=3241598 RepID=UPI0035320BA3
MKKLNLKNLEVKSFVTLIDHKNGVQGGLAHESKFNSTCPPCDEEEGTLKFA